MKKIVSVLALLLLAAAFVRPGHSAEPELQFDTWSSFSMQAKSISGELRYQDNDFDGARQSFKDSLNSGSQEIDPNEQFMGLDLFRMAEIAAIDKDYPSAYRYLDILIHRYPNSQWARKGRRLLVLLGGNRSKSKEEASTPMAPMVFERQPEMMLRRLQGALREDKVREALRLAGAFLKRYPRHALAEETSLLEGLLLLRVGEPASAVQVLKRVRKRTRSPELRSKAVYLLGAAYHALGDFDGLRASVPSLAPGKGGGKWDVLSQVWLANAEETDGRHDEAMRRYLQVAAAPHRSSIQAYVRAALAVEDDRIGRLAEAERGMRLAVREADESGRRQLGMAARLSLGHILYKRRRFRQAISAYSDFSKRYREHPWNATATFFTGIAHKRLGQHDSAIASFYHLVKAYPESRYEAEAHLQLGQIYAAMGRTKNAVLHYASMARSAGAGPDMQKESRLLIARVHYNRKDYRSAVPHYREFLEKHPDDPRAGEVEELLLTSYWMGDRSDPEIPRAISLYPGHPIVAHIRWDLGRKAFNAGDHKAAEEHFGRLAADFPEAPTVIDALLYRGESLSALGDPGGAASVYKDLVARFPKTKQARKASFKLGTALFQAGDYNASEAAYRKLQKGDDDLAADALFNRALALSKTERKQEALDAYWNLMKRFPRYERAPLAWFKIGSLRESLGRLTDAAAAYRKVTGERRSQALFNAGRVWEKLEKRGSARAEYKKLQRTGTKGDSYRLHGLLRLGLLYEMDSRPSSAIPIYKIVAADGFGTKEAETADKRLQALAGRSQERAAVIPPYCDEDAATVYSLGLWKK